MYPEFIQTQFFTLNTIWIFFAIGLIAAVYTFIKLSVRSSLKIQFISEHSFFLILWTLIGARLITLLFNANTFFYEFSFKAIFDLFAIWDKGLSLTGATIGFGLYLYYICKKNKQDFLKWIDVLVPSILVGLSIGYIGTFFEGINYGSPTSLPWGVNFESPLIKYTVPIHPTQIYAFIYSITIAISLIYISKTEKISSLKKSGFIGLVGIIAFSFFKFLENFIRGDDTFLILGIRTPQIASALILISTGIFLYLRYNAARK